MRVTLLLPLLFGCGEQTLTGNKEFAAIEVSPASLTFAEAGSQTVTVSSVGDATLDISSVELRGVGDFTLTSTGGLPDTLAVGDQVDLVVTWAPAGGETVGWL